MDAFGNLEKQGARAWPTAIYSWTGSYYKSLKIRASCMAHCNLQLDWKLLEILGNKGLFHGPL